MARLIRSPFLLSIGVTLSASAAPLAAQQRAEVTTQRPVHGTSSSTDDRELRRLEQRAESLARAYTDGEGVSAADRRRVGASLDATMARIELLLARYSERVVGAGDAMRAPVAPFVSEGAARSMARALGGVRESAPRGWIGIETLGPARVPWVARGELMIRYLAYPEIVSVEPSAPADRAGILPGDTLLAYDGHDVRDSDVPINRLLRPNARVLVRVRRDGRTRDVPVVAADVPQRIRLRGEISIVPSSGLGGRPSFAATPDAPLRPAMPRMPQPVATPPQPVAPLPPAPPVFDFAYNAVAGAQLAAVSAGLGRTLGVQHGVLVTSAPVSSIAYQSGLRDGDVVTAVAGRTVRAVSEVRALVEAAVLNGGHALSLRVLRDRRTRTVTLRWD